MIKKESKVPATTGASRRIVIDISTASPLWDELDFDSDALTGRVIHHAFGQIKTLPAETNNYEVSISLANDELVQNLNRDFRGINKPTNVLSFAALDDPDPAPLPPEELQPLGDIILAFETIRREAEAMDTSFQDHLSHLLVHGLLHLCGYDHEEKDEAEVMEALEISILKQMGIENPYSRPKFMA